MKAITFDAIGTQWSVDIYNSLSEESYNGIYSQIRQRIASFENTYSRFKDDSLITLMSRKAGTYDLPEDGRSMLALYKKLYDLTDGRFTPLIGSVMEDAGYDATYSLKPKTLRKPLSWNQAMVIKDSSITMKKPALLDFGALGKGAIIDEVAKVVKREGVTSFCIDAGGDILYENVRNKRLIVGLENPLDTKQVIGTIPIRNQSLAGSSGNRRAWQNYHHLIDPKTLKPVNTILASWILADTAMLADALATAVFFIEPQKLRDYFTFSYLLLTPDMRALRSDDFPGELYYTDISNKQ